MLVKLLLQSLPKPLTLTHSLKPPNQAVRPAGRPRRTRKGNHVTFLNLYRYVDDIACDAIDIKQFGDIAGMLTTDVLVEITHIWCEATDKLNT